MFPIISTEQLALGMPVVYHQEGRPENPLALVVASIFEDPSVPAWTARSVSLLLRPGGFGLTVRPEHLRTAYGVPWHKVGPDLEAERARRQRDVRTADCYACPRGSHSKAWALTPGGWPACERHVAMYLVAERADRWADDAVAALYLTLGLA